MGYTLEELFLLRRVFNNMYTHGERLAQVDVAERKKAGDLYYREISLKTLDPRKTEDGERT